MRIEHIEQPLAGGGRRRIHLAEVIVQPPGVLGEARDRKSSLRKTPRTRRGYYLRPRIAGERVSERRCPGNRGLEGSIVSGRVCFLDRQLDRLPDRIWERL